MIAPPLTGIKNHVAHHGHIFKGSGTQPAHCGILRAIRGQQKVAASSARRGSGQFATSVETCVLPMVRRPTRRNNVRSTVLALLRLRSSP